MVSRLPWEHEAQFESDVFNRGTGTDLRSKSVLLSKAKDKPLVVYNYQMEDGRAHNPEVAGSNPVPATLIETIRKEEEQCILQ